MTYAEYVAYATAQKFQPLGEAAFNSLVRAGFNPVTKEWTK